MTLIEHLESDIQHRRKYLAQEMKTLALHLNGWADKIATDYTPNSLGEIQGRASMIDAQCGELYGLIKTRRKAIKLEELQSCNP